MVSDGSKGLRLGVWTPLPHTIPSEPRMEDAIARLRSAGGVGEQDLSFAFACEAVQKAEAAGFSITLVAERYLGPDLEALTLGAALAARTQKIEILVAAHPGVIPPQVVAKMALSIDRISAGRCALNIVNGWWADEFAVFSNGAALDGEGERYQRMREYIELIAAMTSGESVHYEGRFYRAHLDAFPMRAARGRIPLYAASRAPEGRNIVAETCDVWFVDYAPDHRAYEDNLERIRRDVQDLAERAARAGRKIQSGISCHVVSADDMASAEAAAARLLESGARDRIAAVAAKGLGAGLVGTPELIVERMLAYQAAGVGCFMLHFHPMLAGLDRFIADVLPRLRARCEIL
jgi:FMNH2-dependent dimethyl sulfone monooxygenase